MVCHYKPNSKRKSMKWKNTDSLVKAVSKEGHADSVLEDEMTHHYWFPWKRCHKAVSPTAYSLGKIYLIYWMTLIYV